jgi:hypothetical protein
LADYRRFINRFFCGTQRIDVFVGLGSFECIDLYIMALYYGLVTSFVVIKKEAPLSDDMSRKF